MEFRLIAAAAAFYVLPALLLFISSFLYKIYGNKGLKAISTILLVFALFYYFLIAFKYAGLFNEGFLSALFMVFQIFAFAVVFISALMIFYKK